MAILLGSVVRELPPTIGEAIGAGVAYNRPNLEVSLEEYPYPVETESTRKILALMTLAAALLVVSAPTNHTAIAQGTKKDKDAKTTKGVGHIEIGKGKDDKYRFSVRDADGKYLAGSAPYATEKDINEAIEAFRKVVAGAKVTTKKAEKAKD